MASTLSSSPSFPTPIPQQPLGKPSHSPSPFILPSPTSISSPTASPTLSSSPFPCYDCAVPSSQRSPILSSSMRNSPEPSLTHRLSAFKQQFLPQLQRLLGDERYRVFNEENLRLQALHRGSAYPPLSIGDVAPDFILPDQEGRLVHLADLLLTQHVIVHFYRGSWCPYCNLALQAHAQYCGEYDDFGATMVAITPSLPQKTAEQMAAHHFPFPLLTDTHLETIPAYHLISTLTTELKALHMAADGLGIDLAAFYGDDKGNLPIPATYVIEKGSGRIVWAHVDADFTVRADPLDIIEALQELRQAEESLREF